MILSRVTLRKIKFFCHLLASDRISELGNFSTNLTIVFKQTILVKQAPPCLFELTETGREAPVLPAQKYYLKPS
jgi:hypothetical protein